MNILQRLSRWVLTSSLSVGLSSFVIADDVEIYIGSNEAIEEVQPNILFIIDSSGSMNATIRTVEGTYDSSVTYDGGFRTNDIYWNYGGSVPTGTSRRLASPDANRCAASFDALANQGYYLGAFAGYSNRRRNRRWNYYINSTYDDKIECVADRGVHGDVAGDGRTYIRRNKGTPEWVSGFNSGSYYTTGIYTGNYLNWYYNYAVTNE